MRDSVTTPDLTGYEWPTCSAGPGEGPGSHPLWEDELHRQVCRPCEDKTRKRLGEIKQLFIELNKTSALMRGARQPGVGSSGSKTPPIPPRLEVLTLTAAGGAATRLRDIEDAWRKALGRRVGTWAGSPTQAVPVHLDFLLINLQTACETYESVGQDVEDIRRLHTQCAAALDAGRKPGRVRIGVCPVWVGNARCGAQLTATTASHRVRCSSCLTEWPDLAAWRELRQAQEDAAGHRIGAAA
jgi:hypothetical protein